MLKRTTEQFIEDVLCKGIHPDGKYNYRMVEYIGVYDEIEIFCNDCKKSFWQKPQVHLRGCGCSVCSHKRISQEQTLTTEIFISKSKQIHGDRYDYGLVEYINAYTKVKIKCDKHKIIFKQTPNHHLRGDGCPKCRRKIKDILYLKENLTIEEEPIEVGSKIWCKCAHCKEYFIPTRQQLSNRISALSGGSHKGESRLYCSNECKQLCSVYNQRVYYKDHNKPDRSREVQPELRKMVLERDGYICQRCDSTDNLHCHHYEGIEVNPIESADIDNCITLCDKCHDKVHNSGQCDVRRKPCEV